MKASDKLIAESQLDKEKLQIIEMENVPSKADQLKDT